jgi:hypothetical protein
MTKGSAPAEPCSTRRPEDHDAALVGRSATLAYADKGEVFVQRIDEEQAAIDHAEAEEGPAAPARGGEEERIVLVVSFSRDGSKLLITSKKAGTSPSVADGSRERVLTLDDKNEDKNPKLTRDRLGASRRRDPGAVRRARPLGSRLLAARI